MSNPMNPIFCAIDTPDPARLRDLVRTLHGLVGGFKLGLEFFVANGPSGVDHAALGPGELFLDLKLHDIPNTVEGAVRQALRLRPKLLTLHCGGGSAMMRAAATAAKGSGTKLIGVTVLTSLDEGDLAGVGQMPPLEAQVRRLALLARASGLDGVVCSPHEVTMLKAACGPDFLLVVPGIRQASADQGDQKRVMSARAALAAGADILVIGRPITAAPDPAAAARALLQEIG
ncbi:MAG TPA: orotidine-5'-phosphate decarboxylase [Stellaceae bacterium]|nr:orotidine-5'-phosphate decarboxylase [Stellaceae bacterium]